MNRFVLTTLPYFLPLQSPDGYTVVSAAADETLRFWNFFGGPDTSKKAKIKDARAAFSNFHTHIRWEVFVQIYLITMDVQLKVIINVFFSLYKALLQALCSSVGFLCGTFYFLHCTLFVPLVLIYHELCNFSSVATDLWDNDQILQLHDKIWNGFGSASRCEQVSHSTL